MNLCFLCKKKRTKKKNLLFCVTQMLPVERICPLNGYWEEKRVVYQNIWPSDKVSGGKWHCITQRETNLICHFSSAALRHEGRADRVHPVSQLLSTPTVSRAQQQLGTLINLSKGSDLFICKRPTWTPPQLCIVCKQRKCTFPLGLT